jgi:hypothetical protein
MIGLGRLKAELLATQTLLDLFERAEKCRALYEEAEMALPEPLKRFLGLIESSNGHGSALPYVVIPGPRRSKQPPEAGPDWIWISAKSASTQSVVMALLRQAPSPIRARDMVELVQEVLPEVPKGSVANVGTRLSGKEIERTDAGWSLRSPELAGVLFDGQLWGPPSIFGKYELAAHRRGAILHLLSFTPAGLQATQIEEQLRRCSWLKAPVNKDLLKEDINFLSGSGERKIRRRGASRKWELTPEGYESLPGEVSGGKEGNDATG